MVKGEKERKKERKKESQCIWKKNHMQSFFFSYSSEYFCGNQDIFYISGFFDE